MKEGDSIYLMIPRLFNTLKISGDITDTEQANELGYKFAGEYCNIPVVIVPVNSMYGVEIMKITYEDAVAYEKNRKNVAEERRRKWYADNHISK